MLVHTTYNVIIFNSSFPLQASGARVGQDPILDSPAAKTLPDELTLGQPTIPGCPGLGVFAAEDLPRGCLFGPYGGVLNPDLESARASGYAWEVSDIFFVTLLFFCRLM